MTHEASRLGISKSVNARVILQQRAGAKVQRRYKQAWGA